MSKFSSLLTITLLFFALNTIGCSGCSSGGNDPHYVNCEEILSNPSQACIDIALVAVNTLNTCVDECPVGDENCMVPCFDSYIDTTGDDCFDGGAFDPAACGACYEQCGLNFAECMAIPHPAWTGSLCLETLAYCHENCYLNPEVICQDVIDTLYSMECQNITIDALEDLNSCSTGCNQNESCIQSCNASYNEVVLEGCWPPNIHPNYNGFVCGPCFISCGISFFDCMEDPNDTAIFCAMGNDACIKGCPQNWVFPE